MSPILPTAYLNRWWSAMALKQFQLPRYLSDWLLDTGSLTARLQQLSHRGVCVQLHRQQWQRLPGVDKQLLGAWHRPSWGLVRTVSLRLDNHALVWARSVFPAKLLAQQRRFKCISRAGLGHHLFRARCYPAKRCQMQWIAYQASHPLVAEPRVQLAITDSLIWGRRSVFDIGDQSLMVSEFFSPQLWRDY